MSDAAPPDHVERTAAGHGAAGSLTPAAIDALLGDFRVWLEQLAHAPPATPPANGLSLQSIVAQFTALRHDVNMQTKAARAAIEQTTTALGLLQQPEEEATENTLDLQPIIKTLLDVHDALSVAHRQMEKAKQAAGDFAKEVGPIPQPTVPKRKFFTRWFTLPAYDSLAWTTYHEKLTAHQQKLQQQFAAVADGYAMSLRRIERTFPDLGLEPIATLGDAFDAEMMEVVDAETSTAPAGSVLEVVRQGYVWNEAIFRYAQVKVAK